MIRPSARRCLLEHPLVGADQVPRRLAEDGATAILHSAPEVFVTPCPGDELFHLGVGKAGLYPGDVILTGTPAGIGAGRGEFLKPGDVVKLWIKKIGSLTNTMI